MKHTVLGLVLLVAGAVLAQQSPPTMPPSTPPTFPEDRAPRQETPPSGEQAEPRNLTTPEVQQQIVQGFSAEPMLRNSNVDVQVDENSVILTGSVKSEQQHDRALRIVESYSGDRKIVDKIKVTQVT
jgi:hypothetical protein